MTVVTGLGSAPASRRQLSGRRCDGAHVVVVGAVDLVVRNYRVSGSAQALGTGTPNPLLAKSANACAAVPADRSRGKQPGLVGASRDAQKKGTRDHRKPPASRCWPRPVVAYAAPSWLPVPYSLRLRSSPPIADQSGTSHSSGRGTGDDEHGTHLRRCACSGWRIEPAHRLIAGRNTPHQPETLPSCPAAATEITSSCRANQILDPTNDEDPAKPAGQPGSNCAPVGIRTPKFLIRRLGGVVSEGLRGGSRLRDGHSAVAECRPISAGCRQRCSHCLPIGRRIGPMRRPRRFLPGRSVST